MFVNSHIFKCLSLAEEKEYLLDIHKQAPIQQRLPAPKGVVAMLIPTI